MTREERGALDFLKTISSHPWRTRTATTRWYYLGLVNEPCFEKATGPDPKRYGLWLDQRKADCPPDPFENGTKYPGVQTGARGKTVTASSVRTTARRPGSSDCVCFRIPDFDEARGQEVGSPSPYYTEPGLLQRRKDLVRPYRVGMSCGVLSCRAEPVNPPADPEQPEVGESQLECRRAVFLGRSHLRLGARRHEFRVPAVPHLPARHARHVVHLDRQHQQPADDERGVSSCCRGCSKRSAGERRRWPAAASNNHQFNDYVKDGPLTQFFQAPDTVWTPRVLKDGSDSVGALGALNRVYLNIGTVQRGVAAALQRARRRQAGVADRDRRGAQELRVLQGDRGANARHGAVLPKTTAPHHLADAPGGEEYLTKDAAILTRGKEVFAEQLRALPLEQAARRRCPARSGRLRRQGLPRTAGTSYWAWTQDADEFKQKMREIVAAPTTSSKDNYLSTEFRVPVTLLQTNACSPLATNAIGGNIWDNFSSQSYKELPSVGQITWYHPYTGEPRHT